jgi:hypothetical protein
MRAGAPGIELEESMNLTKLLAACAVALLAMCGSAAVHANLSCGIAPIPPIGCKVGPCVCDEHGQNCKWTFTC